MGVRTDKQMEADCEAGNRLAAGVLPIFDGMSPYVAYNAIGVVVCSIFASVEFKRPQHALEEFENWVKFTREHLTEIIKERIQ